MQASKKSFLVEWLTTVDHKKIGILYFFSAIFFLFVAGLEALLIRTQLIVPNNDFLVGMAFNKAFTMHGTIFFGCYALERSGFFGGFWIHSFKCSLLFSLTPEIILLLKAISVKSGATVFK